MMVASYYELSYDRRRPSPRPDLAARVAAPVWSLVRGRLSVGDVLAATLPYLCAAIGVGGVLLLLYGYYVLFATRYL